MTNRCWTHVAVPALLLTAIAIAGHAHAAKNERKVTIGWKEVEGVKEFELQLSKDPRMDPILTQKRVTGVKHEVTLEPATYYFRVRGFDAKGIPGPWAEVQGFVVTPKPPQQEGPADGRKFDPAPKEGIEFTWEGVGGKDGFQLEVTDDKGIALRRTVRGQKFLWVPQASGKYRWRVGAESATRTDWSPYRTFEAVMPRVAAPTTYVAEVEENRPVGSGSPSSLSVIGRWAQAVLAYSALDSDSGIAATGSAVVALLSAELRWRAGRSSDSPWVLSGSLNFEMIRQTVFLQTFTMPRTYARVFYTKGRDAWRAGPFVHFSMGKGGIFIASGPTTGISTTVQRMGMGLGGVAVYQIAPASYLSALLLLRMDSGGSSPELPNVVGSAMGFETGFGIVVSLSETLMLEGRLRGLKEGYKWQPATGSTGSYQNNTFIIIDVGVGIKF